ncbi:MAG: septum formation protein Maf [Saprospiraceae bacterium]|nr:septum formation protein Maf [Saprospiraceae bacterium]
MNRRKIILASGSPRRKQLLEESGFWFDTVFLDFDEQFPPDLSPELVAVYLAEKKAAASKAHFKDDEILLTADSVVVMGKQIFNKPTDYMDAYRILATLSGKTHQVYTGVCLKDSTRQISFTGKSTVSFREMYDGEIKWYIEKYKPYDKAGAYAVQEWIGLCKISQIEGTYSNIMGLPTDLVYEALRNFDGALSLKD